MARHGKMARQRERPTDNWTDRGGWQRVLWRRVTAPKLTDQIETKLADFFSL